MNIISNFTIWCSGANKTILEDCPIERTKFVGIGSTIFLTAILAMLSGGYAIHFTFENLNLTIPFALLWGVIIFNLDRYIVSSLKKTGIFWQEFFIALPRFLIAIVLGITISKPIELRLFDARIQKQLNQTNRSYVSDCEQQINMKLDELRNKINLIDQNLKEKKSDVFNRDPEYQNLKNRIPPVEEKINQLKNQYNKNYLIIQKNTFYRDVFNPVDKTYRKEIYYSNLGNSKIRENKNINSQILSLGFEISKINGDIDTRQKQLSDLVKTLEEEANTQKQPLLDEIKRIQSSQGEEISKCKDRAEKSTDLPARLEALGSIKNESSSVGWASFFITLLFILLESIPVLVKLITRRGPYDEILERMEYENMIEQKRIISQLNMEISEKLIALDEAAKMKGQVLIQTEKDKIDIELKSNKEILADIAEKQGHLAKLAIDAWYKNELKKLEISEGHAYINQTGAVSIGTASPGKFTETLWCHKNQNQEFYYLFKEGANNDHEVELIQNSKSTKGSWYYTIPQKQIRVNILNTSNLYDIDYLDAVSLRLKLNGKPDMLDFYVV